MKAVFKTDERYNLLFITLDYPDSLSPEELLSLEEQNEYYSNSNIITIDHLKNNEIIIEADTESRREVINEKYDFSTDIGISEIIDNLNECGIHTLFSCMGHNIKNEAERHIKYLQNIDPLYENIKYTIKGRNGYIVIGPIAKYIDSTIVCRYLESFLPMEITVESMNNGFYNQELYGNGSGYFILRWNAEDSAIVLNYLNKITRHIKYKEYNRKVIRK